MLIDHSTFLLLSTNLSILHNAYIAARKLEYATVEYALALLDGVDLIAQLLIVKCTPIRTVVSLDHLHSTQSYRPKFNKFKVLTVVRSQQLLATSIIILVNKLVSATIPVFMLSLSSIANNSSCLVLDLKFKSLAKPLVNQLLDLAFAET